MTAGVIFSFVTHISHIFSMRDVAKVFPPVIKAVVVNVVNALARLRVGYVAVHKERVRPTILVADSTPCVRGLASLVYNGMPFMGKNFGIFVINYCEKAARKWNLFHNGTVPMTTLVCKENF